MAALFCRCFLLRSHNTSAMISNNPPIAAPTPIPAFAPVDSPDSPPSSSESDGDTDSVDAGAELEAEVDVDVDVEGVDEIEVELEVAEAVAVVHGMLVWPAVQKSMSSPGGGARKESSVGSSQFRRMSSSAPQHFHVLLDSS